MIHLHPGYPKSSLTASMFDHSNPSAFQQVFHFLFNALHGDKVSQEFRDCWPILDKKQEADFRRRVTNMIKDCQKEHPDELPYTNPSLFQSPGGRKFLAFLSVFTTFVMKQLITKTTSLLRKPTVKSKKLKLIAYKNLVDKTGEALESSVTSQLGVEEVEKEGSDCVNKIWEKYSQHKERLQELGDAPTTSLEEFEVYHSKVEFVKKTLEDSRALTDHAKESFDAINYVMDGGVEKTKLNLEQLVDANANISLVSAYQSLIRSVMMSVEKVVTETSASVNMSQSVGIKQELETTSQMKNSLEKFYDETKSKVSQLEAQSRSIVSLLHVMSS